MSRVGRNPIPVPDGVKVTVKNGEVLVKGKLGELTEQMHKGITIREDGTVLHVERSNDTREQRALHGLMRSLVNNMVVGVSSGFTKRLRMYGTGYRATAKGKNLELLAGYSHPVTVEPLGANTLSVDGNTTILVTGPSKQDVGQQAANIRSIRKPSRFQSKNAREPLFGIAYEGEQLRLRVGKTVAGVGA